MRDTIEFENSRMARMVRGTGLRLWAGLVSATALAVLGGGSVHAASLDVQYAVSLAGLPLGTATLTGDVSRSRYKINVQAHLTGLAGMVTGGKGAAVSTGTFQGGRVMAGAYSLTAATSDMTRTVQMGIEAGAVQNVVVNPPLDEKPDRVLVRPEHKRGVIDPVSALLMPADTAKAENADACNRSIPVFDGAQRFDVPLSYAGIKLVKAVEGYSGPVVVCKARYQPIAGHRSERPAIKYMQNNRDMEAWMAPVPGEGVFIPFRISVKTQVGTAVIHAKRFVAEGVETTAKIK